MAASPKTTRQKSSGITATTTRTDEVAERAQRSREFHVSCLLPVHVAFVVFVVDLMQADGDDNSDANSRAQPGELLVPRGSRVLFIGAMPPRRRAASPKPAARLASSDAPATLEEEPAAEKGWRVRLKNYTKAATDMGGLPLALVLFVPRTCLSFLVIAVAMWARSIARLFLTTSGYQKKANLRILIITDYLPPQTHGIAIRFSHYIHYMRRQGHEVQVFCTNTVRETESSFDHPNLPAIINPYNVKNKMAYSAGVKLAWYLGAKQWDMVHLVCPSNIPWPVLPVVAWRRIPIYVSHHVDMSYYIYEYVKVRSAPAHLHHDHGCCCCRLSRTTARASAAAVALPRFSAHRRTERPAPPPGLPFPSHADASTSTHPHTYAGQDHGRLRVCHALGDHCASDGVAGPGQRRPDADFPQPVHVTNLHRLTQAHPVGRRARALHG